MLETLERECVKSGSSTQNRKGRIDMKKYSEIKLDENQKEFLQMLLDSGYTTLKQDEGFGLMATGVTDDEHKVLLLSGIVEPNTFNWVKDYEPCEIEKVLNPPHEPKTVWDLKKGDVYWWIASSGYIFKQGWNNAVFEVEYRKQGNVFSTEEEAEFESTRRAVVAKVKKYARPFKEKEMNFFPCYDRNYGTIAFQFNFHYQLSMDYFSSVEDIKQAIAEVGEDYFKKYYLGVVEE